MICVCLSVCQPVYTDRLLYKRLSHPRKIIFSSLKKIIKSYGGGGEGWSPSPSPTSSAPRDMLVENKVFKNRLVHNLILNKKYIELTQHPVLKRNGGQLSLHINAIMFPVWIRNRLISVG